MNKEELSHLVELVVQKKDEKTFEQLIKLLNGKIVFIFYKYTIPFDDQKDIFQEFCIKLWISLTEKKYEEKGAGISAFAGTIATNLCIDYLRLKKKNNKVPIENIGMYKNDVSINIPQYDELFSKEDSENLKRFIKSLPRDQRVVYFLRILKGKSFKEIAEYLGISINTVLGRMRYIRLNFEKNRQKFNL